MHTESEIRMAIKPIIEKYGQLNTTELKSILAEYIEYDEEDLKESDTRNTETFIEKKISNIVFHAKSDNYIYPEGFIVDKNFEQPIFFAISGLSGKEERLSDAEIMKRQNHAKTKRDYKKFDWEYGNERTTLKGALGETFVYYREIDKVKKIDTKSAFKVIRLSVRQGDSFGYDICSVNENGETIFIEVKTTKGPVEAPFFMSKNERAFFKENIDNNAFIYRVYNFNEDSRHGDIKIISAKELFENYNFDPVSFIVTPK